MEIKQEITIIFDDNKELKLTETEAKQIYNKLKEMFGENYTVTYPWCILTEPIDLSPTWIEPYTTCDNTSNNITCTWGVWRTE